MTPLTKTGEFVAGQGVLMSDWKAKVKRPLTNWVAYELLGEMIKADATWPDVEKAFQAMLASEPVPESEYAKRLKAAQNILDMHVFRKRYRGWLSDVKR